MSARGGSLCPIALDIQSEGGSWVLWRDVSLKKSLLWKMLQQQQKSESCGTDSYTAFPWTRAKWLCWVFLVGLLQPLYSHKFLTPTSKENQWLLGKSQTLSDQAVGTTVWYLKKFWKPIFNMKSYHTLALTWYMQALQRVDLSPWVMQPEQRNLSPGSICHDEEFYIKSQTQENRE